MNQTGLNLIRIIIGSYFLAVSLDLVIGVDQTVMFAPFVGPYLADLVGSTLLFFISVLFMTGVLLRTTSLMLALYVLSCSALQNFMQFDLGNVSDFWRDLTLACAVILNYSSLGRRELRRASVLTRRARIQHTNIENGVMPRRVTLSPAISRPEKTKVRPAAVKPNSPVANILKRYEADSKDDVHNIFVNV